MPRKNEVTYVGLGELTYKEAADGSLYVYGVATDPTLDMDKQYCDPDWLKSAMPAWFSTGANVREQHSAIAAGVGIELSQEGDKWMLKSEVVDPVTATKVKKGVLKGYSIGIKNARVLKSDIAPNGVIAGGDIVEISLVDRPANPSARIEIAKSVNGEFVMTDIDKDSVSTEDILEDSVQTESVENDVNGQYLPCGVCAGTGQIHTDDNTWNPCEACDGTGKAPEVPHVNESVSNPDGDELETALDEKEVDADVEKREFTDAERKEAEAKGQAMPGGGFPIKTVQDLKNAIQSVGRAKDPAAAKAHIKDRAKALGREDLIPDTWKGADADLEKADDMEHDPADLASVRAGLIALIKAELDEMLAGDENEIADVSELLTTLSIFLDWWTHEASENETEAPFTGWDDSSNDSSGDDMAYIGLGVSADLIKSATATDATEEVREELRSEIVKALGLDETITKAALSEAKEELELLKAELASVKEMATPGGPALRQTQNQAMKSGQVDQLRAEANYFRQMAERVTEANLKSAYFEKAVKIDRDADAISRGN